MKTITSDSGMPAQPPEPTLDLLALLAGALRKADPGRDGREKVSISAGNSGQAVKTASGLWRVLGVTPRREEP